jgi:hypothetical protein
LQGVGQRDSEPAGQMVVAAAGKAQFARFRGQGLAPYRLGRTDRRELFERLRHMGAGEPVITMAPLAFDREQAAVSPPREVRTGVIPAQ